MKKHFTKLITAAVLSANLLTGCNAAPDITVPVGAGFVAQSPAAVERITVRGVVESVESRRVYSSLGFEIERVYVEAGDVVVKGQTLAVLDTDDLGLTVAQNRAALTLARQTANNAIVDADRMLSEAQRNLANNTNLQILNAEAMLNAAQVGLAAAQSSYNTHLTDGTNIHIVNANAALNAAETGLVNAQRDFDAAVRDYEQRNNPHVLAAESALTAASIELDAMLVTHENLTLLFEADIISREELRQSETALTHLQNAYNDAQTMLGNAVEAEQRFVELAELALHSAITNVESARSVLDATRIAVETEAELLRQNVRRFSNDVASANAMLTASQVAAEQQLEQLRFALRAAELAADLEHMELALRQLERRLDDSAITAPVGGTVTTVIAREGAAGTGLLFVIEDTENLRVNASFREYDIARIETGMAVVITSDAAGAAEYAGVITRINPAADITSPVVTFETEILITEPTSLRIGMNTRVTVEN